MGLIRHEAKSIKLNQAEINLELGRKSFVGQEDTANPYPAIFYPGVYYTLSSVVPNGALPFNDLDGRLYNGVLHSSTRSKMAQIGLNLTGLHFLHDHNRQLRANFFARVLGPRPIVLDNLEGVASFYNVDGAKRLRGEELYRLVKEENLIQISGKYGVDWFISPLHIVDGQEAPVLKDVNAITLRLKQKRWAIEDSDKPIMIGDLSSEMNHLEARRILDDQVFKEIGPDDDVPFCIGETESRVVLKPGVVGVLSSMANMGQENWSLQINSLLIKPGTDNPIRTEMWTPTVFKETEDDIGWPTGFTGEVDIENQFVFMQVYVDKDLI